MLKLQRNEELSNQIGTVLEETIKENLFWEGGHVYVGIYPLDDGVYADIGGRQNGSFSPDEKYFKIVFHGFQKSDDYAIDWEISRYDEESGRYVEIPENFRTFIQDMICIDWEALEELEAQAWKEYDEINNEGA